MNVNVVLLGGNITADIDSKIMPSGDSVAQFVLAINRKFKTKDGEIKEEVSFIKCVAFGKMADNLKLFCGKGSPVLVEGRLKQERWETPEGQKRDKTVLIAENIQFLGKKKEENEFNQDTTE